MCRKDWLVSATPTMDTERQLEWKTVYEISDAIVEHGLVDGVRSFVRQQRVRRTAENSSAVCR